MKFVIHHHQTLPEHYDLMLEEGNSLLTWRIDLEEFPAFLEGRAVSAERIRDHRKDYLDYEGPVSCSRGMVRAFDRGDCRFETRSGDVIHARISGKELSGLLIIQETKDRASIRLLPDES